MYRLDNSSKCSLEVKVGSKWLGLEFKLLDSKLEYLVDTDLYDIRKDENNEFATEIEREIIFFLNSLANGNVKITAYKGRPVMLIPSLDGAVLLKQSRFLTSKPLIKNQSEIEREYSFRSFSLKD